MRAGVPRAGQVPAPAEPADEAVEVTTAVPRTPPSTASAGDPVMTGDSSRR